MYRAHCSRSLRMILFLEDQPKQEAAPVVPTIDYEKIRDIVKEEVDKTFKGKQKNYKEAK